MAGRNGTMLSFTKVVLPSVLASFIPAYVFWDLTRNKKVLGGSAPRSYADPEWGRETDRKMDKGWPREAGPPVVLNPISRQNFRVIVD